MTAAESADLAERYDPRDSSRSGRRGGRAGPVPRRRRSDDTRPRNYVLDMFPYPRATCTWATPRRSPSATSWRATGSSAATTCCTRSAGTPSGCPPRTRRSSAARTRPSGPTRTSRRRRRRSGGTDLSFDWSRRLHTCDPDYYRWNQWLFLRFHERGLAYRKEGPSTGARSTRPCWPTSRSSRASASAAAPRSTKRKLTQWYFKITEYADRLLDDMEQLEGYWPERVLLMQRNWIGRSEGADVDFPIEGRDEPVTVFTTRPDTLYGATFFVVAADGAAGRQIAPRIAGPAATPTSSRSGS